MLKVVEFLDIEAVEKLRFKYLNCGLDYSDDFSLHYALFDGEILCGTGRLFRKKANPKEIVIDKISLTSHNETHFEMIFRSLLLKCFYINCERVFAKAERQPVSFYQKFGLIQEGKYFCAELDKIEFPKQCKCAD